MAPDIDSFRKLRVLLKVQSQFIMALCIKHRALYLITNTPTDIMESIKEN